MHSVLLTSVGRRSYMVDFFRRAVGDTGRVICANTIPDTPAMAVADHPVVVPHSRDAAYVPRLLELCQEHQVGLLCSMHDLDTYYLSQHRGAFEAQGVRMMVPDAEWGRICLDKLECTRVLVTHGLAVPWSGVDAKEVRAKLADGSLAFPLILKARMGFGSLGLVRCDSLDELTLQEEYMQLKMRGDGSAEAGGILYQQGLTEQEYCLDVVNDLDGNYQGILAVEVHSMRSGETDQVTTTAPDDAMVALAQTLSSVTRHPGIWGVDVIRDQGALKIIDMNPRFTGDYPFHQICGADVPGALVAWSRGESPPPSYLTTRTSTRCYKDLVPRIAGAHPPTDPA